jgi:hypothetical protein
LCKACLFGDILEDDGTVLDESTSGDGPMLVIEDSSMRCTGGNRGHA